MPSMSYCAMENTVSELEQVVEILEEAIRCGYHDMNSYEVDSLERLESLSKDVIKLLKQFHTNRVKHKDHEADEAMDGDDEWGIDDDDDSDDDVESEQ